MIDILAIGAHPDDVEIAIGGTIALLQKRNKKILICDATNGEPTPNGSIEIRKKESLDAAKVLGVDRITLDMPNRYLLDNLENRYKLALVIREYKPKVILCPYNGGEHPDHRKISQITDAARFYAKLTKTDMHGEEWKFKPYWCPRIYYYLGLGLWKFNIIPSFEIDITDVLDIKYKALECYKSQFQVKNLSLIKNINCDPVTETFWTNKTIKLSDTFFD